ncbi:unnamed protein product [Dracunculus medinensis]|uniref:EF-hand domain-containing protein n=1 Tax=Dracunculus medinensis TaxID=318479 RepID=A0A158Q3H2_DRAME|nr:unnamed protein product [Dracunculus medinensis]
MEREKQMRDLYSRLDSNNDGTIDMRDLLYSLHHEKPHIPRNLAKDLFDRMDTAGNEKIHFAEFMNYVTEHEKRLEFIFSDLDRNKDGNEFRSAVVDLSGFKDFLLLYPSSDPKDIARFWKHNLIIDIGEDSQVPEDFTLQELNEGVWWRHLVAGGIAGCMSRTCTAPLDRLKVYLQVNFFTILYNLSYLYDEGGLKSFWRGNGINVVKIAPESAIKFMAYEQWKRLIQKFGHGQELCVQERFVAGSLAGVFSQSIIYPLEVLKTRLALRKTGELNKGLIHFALKMCKNEGLLCFYKGFVPNLIGIIPYAGIDLAIYETLKNMYMKLQNNSEPGVLALLTCGTCSSTCGQLASYPLALIRTRLQARAVSGNLNQPATMSGQLRYILTNEGFFGLYRGIAPNFLKVAPAVGISYVVYEAIRKQLGASMT